MLKGKYIDLNYLDQLSEGDKGFFQDMINSFLKDAPGVIIKMENHLNQKQWKELGDLAHSFKNSLTFMGINELSNTVREVEQSCRTSQNIKMLSELVGEIKTTCHRAIEELITFRTLYQG